MKFRFMFLALCFSPVPIFAQNWMPFPVGDILNFQHEDSTHISSSYWIDSVVTEGPDTLFYLNRVVRSCPACGIMSNWYGYLLARQGQYWRKVMRKSPDGALRFTGDTTLVLLPFLQPGDSWIFDTVQAITATMGATAANSVLGEPDSIKTITLSNGGLIRLSKNHGIVAFPAGLDDPAANLLVGIEGRDLGAHVPDWKSVFDFAAGDVFQYIKVGWGSFYNTVDSLRCRIISTVKTNSQYSYDVQVYRKRSYSESGFSSVTYDSIATTWIRNANTNLIVGLHPQQQLVNKRVRLLDHPLYGLTVAVGEDNNSTMMLRFPDLFEPISQGSDTMRKSFAFNHQFDVYCSNGLGETYTYDGYPYENYTELLGYVKNGDTSGYIHRYPFDIFPADTSSNPPDTTDMPIDTTVIPGDTTIVPIDTMLSPVPGFTVAPTPVVDVALITFEHGLAQPAVLEVTDARGVLYHRADLPERTRTYELDMRTASDTVHFIRLRGPGNGQQVRQVVKVRRRAP